MIRSTTRMRGSVLLLGMTVIGAAGSCHQAPPGGQIVVLSKPTGEREHEDAGTAPQAHLGGPLDQVPSMTFKTRKTPKLTADILQLNEQQLVAYLNGLIYDGDTKNGELETVACVHATIGGDTPCASTDGVRLVIQPEIGAHIWKHGDLKNDRHGAIIARIINYETDDRKEATFGFPAHTKVWWLVDFDTVTQLPRSRFFKRTYSTHPPFLEQVGGDQPFYYCDHVHKAGHGEAIAKYVSCSQSLTMQPTPERGVSARSAPSTDGVFRQASFTNAVPLPRRPLVMALTATWITCDMGCCSTTR